MFSGKKEAKKDEWSLKARLYALTEKYKSMILNILSSKFN
jgi:hypothetical protein